MFAADIIRDIPAGAGIGPASVEIYTYGSPDALVTTITSHDGTGGGTFPGKPKGYWELKRNGNLAPWYWKVVSGGVTRIHSNWSTGPARTFNIGEHHIFDRVLGDGVVPDYASELAVVPWGGGTRGVEVGTGAAVVQGVGFVNYGTGFSPVEQFALSANGAGSARIDVVVLRVRPEGSNTNPGQSLLAVVEGTAGAGVPALTNTANTVEFALAQVTVDPGVTSITSGKIADVRGFRATTLVRQPVVKDAKRIDATSNTDVTSTTGQEIGDVATSIVLLNGVVYDVFAQAFVRCKRGSASEVGIAPYIDGSANAAPFAHHDSADDALLSNEHYRAVTGTGGSISCGCLIKRVGSGTATYRQRHFFVRAFPRS